MPMSTPNRQLLVLGFACLGLGCAGQQQPPKTPSTDRQAARAFEVLIASEGYSKEAGVCIALNLREQSQKSARTREHKEGEAVLRGTSRAMSSGVMIPVARLTQAGDSFTLEMSNPGEELFDAGSRMRNTLRQSTHRAIAAAEFARLQLELMQTPRPQPIDAFHKRTARAVLEDQYPGTGGQWAREFLGEYDGTEGACR